MCSKEGRLLLVVSGADLTTPCRAFLSAVEQFAYQAMTEDVSMLSSTEGWKEVRTAGLSQAASAPSKSTGILWAFFMMLAVLVAHFRSLEMCRPTYLKVGTISDEEGEEDVASPPKVHNRLLSLPHVDAEIVFSAPVHRFLRHPAG